VTNDGSPGNAPQTPDAANLGLVRPPVVYLLSIVLGALLGSVWPAPVLPARMAAPLGAVAIVVAVALFSWSVRTFRAAGTPVPGNASTTTIVRTGPYRISRNPIYVAFSLLNLGIAIWVDSLWALGTLFVAIGVMAVIVIPREERYLERKFGDGYLDYKRTVRRWL
jgi:protein-S-isoprenylcysteine O-methyltransferase Ste14